MPQATSISYGIVATWKYACRTFILQDGCPLLLVLEKNGQHVNSATVGKLGSCRSPRKHIWDSIGHHAAAKKNMYG